MDVRLPNGEIIRNVPDGTSKADLVAKLRAAGRDLSWLEPPPQDVLAPADNVEQTAEQPLPPGRMVGGKGGAVQLTGEDVAGFEAVAQNVPQFLKRSGARLVEGLTELPSAGAYAAGYVAGSASPGPSESSFGSAIANARPDPDDPLSTIGGKTREQILAEQKAWDDEHGGKQNAMRGAVERTTDTPVADELGSRAAAAAAPVTESRPVIATREWAQGKRKEAEAALTPAARRALELSLVEKDEAGDLRMGEGVSNPWWWTANVIDVGVQMAPGMGATALSARMGYATRYRQALAEMAAKNVPQSVALRYASREAMAAARRSAIITGGLTEGATAGGQDAAQVREAIDSLTEEQLMSYPGYLELRDAGETHEQARNKIVRDKAAATAVSAGAVVGMTGAPMNAFFGELTAQMGRVARPAAGRLKAAGEAVLGEGAQEFVQEGAEQLIQNDATQTPGASPWEGVLENAITGAVLGGVIGGGTGLALHKNPKAKPTAEKPPEGEGTLNAGIKAAEQAYEKAKVALDRAEAGARDPNVPMKRADLVAAREAHQQAMVDYTRELLHAGAVDPKQQPAVADALRQAEAAGIKSTRAGDTTAEPGQQADKDAPKPLGAKDQKQFSALEAVANAQSVSDEDMQDLVGQKLATITPSGAPLLTPAGKRARTAFAKTAKAVEDYELAGKKEEVKKAAAKPAKKPTLKLPAERREAAAQKEAQRAERAQRPAKTLAQKKADQEAAPSTQDALKATIQKVAQDQEASDKAHAEFGVQTRNPQMRDAFERARRGLPPAASVKARIKLAGEALTKRDAQQLVNYWNSRGANASMAPTRKAMQKRHGPRYDVTYEPKSTPMAKLKNMPDTAEIPGKGKVKVAPVPAAKDAATAYRKAQNITTPEVTDYVKVQPERARRIAKAFDEMKHEPNNPEVKRAYGAMIDETKKQWDQIKKTGLKVEFIKPGQKDPYAASPRLAIEDVRENNHLWVFPTDSGFGSDDKFAKGNPMLEDAGETIGGHKLKNNDVFRIVHDYFGHIAEGNGFRADGEENAWRIHSSMYSPTARRAMTTETRGQNSWVNYGPHGEKNRRASAGETKYADQKIGLLPEEFSRLDDEVLRFKHYSTQANLSELDPSKMGTGSKGEEAKRGGPKVLALYAENGEVEPDVAQGKTEYRVEVPRERLYDASADPRGFYAQARVPVGITQDEQGNLVPVTTRFDMNKFEELVRDAGFDGYYTPNAEGLFKGQARLFVRTPAKRAQAVAAKVKQSSEQKVMRLLTDKERENLRADTVKKLVKVFDELPTGTELASAALAGQAKRGWYERSAKAIVDVFGPDAPRFAALLAAMSPQTSVEWNFRNAASVWVAWDKAGRPTNEFKIKQVMRKAVFPNSKRVGKADVLPAWVNNTVRALTAEDPSTVTLSGPKVDSFAANLRGETDRVTLDAWMANYGLVDQKLFQGSATKSGPGLRPGYLAYTARVREAAELLTQRTGEKWTPAEVQETVWSWAKTVYEQADMFGSLGTASELVEQGEITDDLINATPDFAGLFATPEVRDILAGTAYGGRVTDAVSRLSQAESSVERQASPLTPSDRANLKRAAKRLEELKARRDAGASAAVDASENPTFGIPLTKLNAIAQQIEDVLGVQGTIVEDADELLDHVPLHVQGAVKGYGRHIQGLFLGDDASAGIGHVYYVRSNLETEQDAFDTALHEVVGHMGLRAVLGENYGTTMAAIYSSFPDQVRAAARRNNINLNHPNEAARRYNRMLAAEELVAYSAGRLLGMKGPAAKQSVWNKIVDVVRRALRSLGFISRYSEADIEGLIYRARDYFRRPAESRARENAYGEEVAAAEKKGGPGPIWHSSAERAIEDAPIERGTAGQWIGTIKNTKGVKQEELDWLGLFRWLHDQGGTIRKDQLLDFVRANKIEVGEVMKGAGGGKGTQSEYMDIRGVREIHRRATSRHDFEITLANDADAYRDAGMQYPEMVEASDEDGEHWATVVADDIYGGDRAGTTATQYRQYQTPGGENYRELLLTLPVREDNFNARQAVYNENVGLGLPAVDAMEIAEATYPRAPKFTSHHFGGTPNILAHVRFNERTVDGKKVLFIEEVQSDWHQQGRRKGYADGRVPDTTGWRAHRVDTKRSFEPSPTGDGWRVFDANDALVDTVFNSSNEQDAIREAAEISAQLRDRGVPDAPFKTSWPELAMKRMIRYAAENDFDKIAWTTGAMQADRYDLRKQVQKLMASKVGADRVHIQIVDTAGNPHDLGVHDKSALADVVGKDLADKIAAQEMPNDVYAGNDLAVGGEGMLAFYDRMLPKTVDKYVKKWGAKVQPLNIAAPTSPGEYVVVTHTRAGRVDIMFRVSGEADELVDSFDYDERGTAERKAKNLNAQHMRAAQNVHSLDITPAMRDSVLESQPMFSVKPDLEFEFRDEEDGSVTVYARDKTRIDYSDPESRHPRVGYVIVRPDWKEKSKWTSEDTNIFVSYRGKGVATEMYRAISQRLGKQPAPSDVQTPAGKAMWRAWQDKNIAFSFKQGPTGDPDLDSFISKIGGTKPSLKQRMQQWNQDKADRVAVNAFDRYHGIKRAEDLAGVSSADSGYKSAVLSGSSGELVQSIVDYGPPVWNQGAPDVGQGQSLREILKPLGNNLNLWLTYVAARRASRLMSEGRENLFEPKEIAAALKLGPQHPEFDVVLKAYNQLQTKVLDFAQEAGVIDPAGRALWEHADYIPFYRIIENGQVGQTPKGGKGIGFVRNQIRRLKGGQANIGDPLENIVRNWLSLMDASLKAHAGRQIVDNLTGTGLVTKHPSFEFTQAVIPQSEIKKFIANNPTLVQTLNAVGLDPRKLPAQAFAGLQKMMAVQALTDEDVISVWRAGKREYWKVHDPLLFIGLQELNAKAWGPLMKLLTFPKRLLTAGVTLTPQFSIKNYLRDVWHVFVQGAKVDQTKLTVLPHQSLAALPSTIRMDATARSLLASGGSFTQGYVTAGNPEGATKVVRRAIRGKTAPVVLDSPAKLWRFYRDLQNAAENANRVAIYKVGRAKGLTHKEAAYEARDLLDFSKKGAHPVMQFLVDSVPFFNARVQGLYRLGRALKTDLVAVGLRGLLITAATAAILALNYDDERYKALTDQEKSNYWHFFDVFEEGDHWKFPKPFEVGFIFGTIPEAIGDAMFTNADEPDAVQQSATLVAYSMGQSLNLSPQPQLIWPLVELGINRDSFTGAPILNPGDEKLLPEDQFGPRTSPTYRELAQLMPSTAPEALRSPKQLEHLGRGYLGNLQDYALLATDALVRQMRNEPAPPERAAQDLPGLRDFRTMAPARNTKYLTTLYDLATQAAKAQASLKKAEEAETPEGDARVEELETENAQLLDVADDFVKAAERVNALKKEQREIQLDPDMTAAEKRAEIDAIQEDINAEAEEVWDLRPGGKLNSETAAELMVAPPTARATILRKNNMPHTADLLEQLV